MKFEFYIKKEAACFPYLAKDQLKQRSVVVHGEHRQLYFNIKQLSRYKIPTTLHLLMLVFGVDICKDTFFFVFSKRKNYFLFKIRK